MENGPEAKRLKFNTPVFPVSMSIEAKTQLAILWLADYTIYDVGDTTVAQASHNGADEAGNIIEFTFSIADETIASLDGSIITFLAQGATTITLDFPGNNNYSPQSITKDLIVKKDQVITWDQDLSQVIFGDSPLTLQATTDGPNPVEYSIYLTALGEINGQNLTLNNIEGNTVITAFSPGNDSYKESEEVTKEINIYDENKDTDGDGIPDYLDEFPEQISDSITWGQDLSLNAAESLELTAVSDSGSIVYYQFEDTVDPAIAEISGSTLSTTLAAEGATLKIKAYTVETSAYFSAENIRIMVVKVARDSDGDGIPDATDPWAFQEDDSITWTQDLSAINAGSDITFAASSASGETVLYRFSWNTQTPEPGSTYGSLNGTTFSADIGAEGFEIRVEAYTQASEGHFAASSIRTFTIIERAEFSISISEQEISWDIGVDSEIFLENDGTLTVYGDNTYGELGMGDTSFHSGEKPNITSVKKVAMGQNHSLFLKQDGSVWAAGSNASGQLGDGGASRTTPTRIDALASSNIIDIEAGGASSFFITDNGQVYACGNNNRGQLGIDSYFNASTPTLVSGLTNISSVATSTTHTLFLRSDGTVWGSGSRSLRALGQSTVTGEIYVPAQITRDIDGNPFDNVAAIAVSFSHSIFLKNDNTVWVCGYSNQGQLGTSYVGDLAQYPKQVTVGVPIQQIAAAANISILLDTNGQVWTTGANALSASNIVGYLGVGSSNYRESTFKKMQGTNVGSLTNIIKIQSSEWYGFGVLDQDGYLWWTGDRDPSTYGIPTYSSQKWEDSIHLGLIHEVNGTISTDLTTAKAGDIVTITTVPNSGYITSSITVKDGEGTTVPVTISGDTGTFSMPSRSVIVSAVFAIGQDPAPTITRDDYIRQDDDFDYPAFELNEQYENHYIIPIGDYVLRAFNAWWNNYEPLNFATAEDGSEVNFRIEPEGEGITIYTNSRGDVDMWINTTASAKKFQLIAETEETETKLAGSLSIPIAVRGYDIFTVKVIDPETGEEPTMNEFYEYIDDTLIRHKDYHLEIEATRSGRQVAEITAQGENPPDLQLISENKWSMNSKYYWSNRFNFTMVTHPLYVDSTFTTPEITFAFIKMFIENPSGDTPNYNDGIFGLGITNGEVRLTFYYTDELNRNRTIRGGYGIEGSKVDVLIYSGNDDYRALTADDDWESAISIGVDSGYSDLTSLDGITSDYNLAWYTNSSNQTVLGFTMQAVPPRLVLTDNLITDKTYGQTVNVQIDDGNIYGGYPEIAGVLKNGVQSSSGTYVKGEEVTIYVNLTDYELLQDPPDFTYTMNSTSYSYPIEDITISTSGNFKYYKYIINSEQSYTIGSSSHVIIRVTPR